jgi:heptosyltransferase I
MGSVRRVLIVKLSAMGDILHALPTAAALKDSYPQIEILWAVEQQFASLLEGNSDIDRVIPLPKLKLHGISSFGTLASHLKLVKGLCGGPVDLSIDLQGLTKSALVARASGARVRIGYHWLREAAPLLEKAVPRRPESIHIVEQYLDVARALGANADHPRFGLTVSDEDDAAALRLLREAGCSDQGFVSINPASARAIKEWDPVRFAALIDTLQPVVPCVLVTADKKVAQSVESHARGPVLSLAGKTTLKQLAAVVRRSAVHVCGDTGSGHMAAALGVRVVSLMGPTDAERACPYGQRDTTISHKNLCGTGCDGKRCDFGAPKCMQAIESLDVAETVKACLNNR